MDNNLRYRLKRIAYESYVSVCNLLGENAKPFETYVNELMENKK